MVTIDIKGDGLADLVQVGGAFASIAFSLDFSTAGSKTATNMTTITITTISSIRVKAAGNGFRIRAS